MFTEQAACGSYTPSPCKTRGAEKGRTHPSHQEQGTCLTTHAWTKIFV